MTSPYNDRLLLVIDERIRRFLKSPSEVGTVSSVEATRLRAMVTFDTATVATPVKLAGHTWAKEGDRVLLSRYYNDWYVVGISSRIGGFGAIAEAYGAANHTGFTGATLTLVTSAPTTTITKRWSSTLIDMRQTFAGVFTSIVNTGVEYGLRFTPSDGGSSTDFTLGIRTINPASARQDYTGNRCPSTSNLAAGTYTVAPVWKRDTTFATGTLSTDTDPHSFVVREVV